MMTWIACIIGAYLTGSIPFGVIIGKFKGVDIRQHGSKNIGATNVGRVLGKKLGLLCFGLDFAKGVAPVIVAGVMNGVIDRLASDLTATQMWLWLATAAATVLGHMFSIFLGFRGGKGVATGFGAVAAMWPLLTLPGFGALAVWYVVMRLSKYVSLASMTAVVCLPLFYLLSVIPRDAQDRSISYTIDHLMHASPPFVGTAVIALLVVYQHRGNIARLLAGQEPRTDHQTRRGS